MPTDPVATFFATPADLRHWLAANHDKAKELWVGFHKVGTGKPSITWAQLVDEVLCFGWIDGLRRSIDEETWRIRITPRKPGGRWSKINIGRAEAMIAEGRMTPAGLAAFQARDVEDDRAYSYERDHAVLPAEAEARFAGDPEAWRDWQARSAGYRRAAAWWVVSAKREETRNARLDRLIAACGAGEPLPQFGSDHYRKRRGEKS